jgi:hypothetical protein
MLIYLTAKESEMYRISRELIAKSAIVGILLSSTGSYAVTAASKLSEPSNVKNERSSGNGLARPRALIDGWANLSRGSFLTNDGDLITYTVEHNAADKEVVEFVLFIGYTTSGWAKAIIMPDGQGSEWIIEAKGKGGHAGSGLWAHQVHNGQVLTFRKPKGFGIWHTVDEVGSLGDLKPGDRVTFKWEKD